MKFFRSRKAETLISSMIFLFTIILSLMSSQPDTGITGAAILDESPTIGIQPIDETLFSEDEALGYLTTLTGKFRAGKLDFEKVTELEAETQKVYDIVLDIASSSGGLSGSIRILGANNYKDIQEIQSGISDETVKIGKDSYEISTEIFAMNNIGMEKAVLALPSHDDTDVLLHCAHWDFDNFLCYEWEIADEEVEWTKTQTHVIADVFDFDAYAGGKLVDELSVQANNTEGSTYTIQETNISGCGEITTSGYYTLNESLSGASISVGSNYACILVNADNVSVDCNFFNLSHTADDYAFFINHTFNVTVKNCGILGYEYALYSVSDEDSKIFNNSAVGSKRGVFLDYSDSGSFVDNNISGSVYEGLKIRALSDYIISDNVIEESEGYYDFTLVSSYPFRAQDCYGFVFQDNIGSGGRPINFSNIPVDWSGLDSSQVVLCNASGSNLSDSNVNGSDSFDNNGVYVYASHDVDIRNVTSVENYAGVFTSNSYDVLINNSRLGGYIATYFSNSSYVSVKYSDMASDFRVAYLSASGHVGFYDSNFDCLDDQFGGHTAVGFYVYDAGCDFVDIFSNNFTNCKYSVDASYSDNFQIAGNMMNHSNSGGFGIKLADSNNSIVDLNKVLGDCYSFSFSRSASSAGLLFFNMSDNAIADDGNWSYFSLDYSGTSAGSVDIRPADAPYSLPQDTRSVGERYLKLYGSLTLDEFTWFWLPADEVGRNASNFELWSNPAIFTWNVLNDTPSDSKLSVSNYVLPAVGDSDIALLEEYDLTPPVWDETPSNQLIEYGDSFAYDLNASDAFSSVDTYSINDSDFIIDSVGLVENNTFLLPGKYLLNVSVNDTNDNRLDGLFNVTVQDTIDPVVSLVSPVNGDSSTDFNVTLNCSASDLSSVNLTLYTNISGVWASEDFVDASYAEFVLENLSFGSFEWNCLAEDEYGNSAFAVSNNSYTVNRSSLSVALLDPLINISSGRFEVFNFTVSVTCDEGVCGDVNATLDPMVASGTTVSIADGDIVSPGAGDLFDISGSADLGWVGDFWLLKNGSFKDVCYEIILVNNVGGSWYGNDVVEVNDSTLDTSGGFGAQYVSDYRIYDALEDCNYATHFTTCSDFWGSSCTGEADDTWDDCSYNGNYLDEYVSEMWINGTTVAPGYSMNLTCEFSNIYGGDYAYAWYYNGTGWRLLDSWEWTSDLAVENKSVIFDVDDVLGTHYVRCGIAYDFDTDECIDSDTDYHDNDDVGFVVETGGVEQGTLNVYFDGLFKPSEEYVVGNSTVYSLDANVTCSVLDCGNVSVVLNASPFVSLNVLSLDYLNHSVYSCLGDMIVGDSCVVSWNFSVEGGVGEEVGVYVTYDGSSGTSGDSETINFSISALPVIDPLDSSSWGSVFSNESYGFVLLDDVVLKSGVYNLDKPFILNGNVLNCSGGEVKGSGVILNSSSSVVDGCKFVDSDLCVNVSADNVDIVGGEYYNCSTIVGAGLSGVGFEGVILGTDFSSDSSVDMSDVSFYNYSGKITYDSLSFSSIDTKGHIVISTNHVEVDSLAVLNRSASIILYDLGMKSPRLLKDGVRCDNTVDCNISFDGSNLYANISSFSTYSAAEGAKGIVPYGSGSPFYTTTLNPMTFGDNSCLQGMVEGDECNITWQVNSTGSPGSSFDFFAFVNSSRGFNAMSDIIDVTIDPPVDGVDPVVYLMSPDEGYSSLSENFTLTCNASDDGLNNITLYTNITGSWVANETRSVTGTYAEEEFNLSGLSAGAYVWNCLAFDTSGNGAFASTNRTFTRLSNSPPTHSTPIINTSTGKNLTAEDITAYNISTSDPESNPVTNIYTWNRGGESTVVLTLSFDSNISDYSSANIRDYSSYANNGTLGGGSSSKVPKWTDKGILGGAYTFDGSNDYIDVPDSASLDVNNTFSLEAWVNQSAPVDTTTNFIVGKYDYSDDNRSFLLWTNSSGHPRFTVCPYGTSTGCDYARAPSPITTNEWHHLVATYDGSTMYLYVDGSLVDTDAHSTGTHLSEKPVVIGATPTGGSEFNGTIDEVRIYNMTLTSDQIIENYNSASARFNLVDSSMTLVGENWSACVTPNDGLLDGETKCSANLTVRDIINELPVAENVILNSSEGLNSSREALNLHFTLSDDDGDPTSATINWFLDGESTTSLLLSFATNESNHLGENIIDYSSHKNNGTLGGGDIIKVPQWIPDGIIGGAYHFDGEDDTITVQDDTSLDFSNSLTIEAWVNQSAPVDTTTNFIVGKYDYGDDNRSFLLWTNQSGHPRFTLCSDGTSASCDYVKPESPLSSGDWHHLVGVYNGTAMLLYVDGLLVGTKAHTTGIHSSNKPITIGSNAQGYSEFNGSIDEIRLYNFSLSANQIMTFYNGGSPDYRTINSSQTITGQNWSASITPNDAKEDGVSIFTSNLSVKDISPPEVLLVAPPDGASKIVSWMTIVCNASDEKLKNVTLYTNLTGSWAPNQTLTEAEGLEGQFSFDLAGLSDGNFTWSCMATDDYDNSAFAPENRTVNVTIDEVPILSTPLLNISSPDNTTFDDLYVYNVSSVDPNGADTTHIYNWERNGNSISILHFSFDTESDEWWHQDIRDYSGRGTDGWLGAGREDKVAQWIPDGPSGGAYYFDGVSSVISSQSGFGTQLNKSFSIEAWINQTSVIDAVWNRIVAKYDNETNNRSFILGTNASGNPRFIICEDGYLDSCEYATSDNPLSLNEWHHLVATYDGKEMRVYVDGVLDVMRDQPIGMHWSTEQITIGGPIWGDSYFNGSIDEVRIYDVPLTEEQVALHYNGGQPNYTRLDAGMTTGLETWGAEVTANDGSVDSETKMTNYFTITNEPPTGSSRIYPDPLNVIRPAFGLCEVNDPEFDLSHRFNYSWYLNETELQSGRSNLMFLLHFDNGSWKRPVYNSSIATYESFDGQVPLNATGLSNYSGKFGRDVYISTGDRLVFDAYENINSDAGTIMFWAQPNWDALTEEYERPFFEDGHDDIYIFFDNDTDDIRFRMRINDNLYQTINTSPMDEKVLDDRWMHVAVMWNRSEDKMQIYLDGELVANNTENLDWKAGYPDVGGELYIGTSTGTRTAHCHFDEFAIFDKDIPYAHLYDIFTRPEPIQPGEVYLDNSLFAFPMSNLTFECTPFDGIEYGSSSNYTITVPGNTIANVSANITKTIIATDGVVDFTSVWTTNYSFDGGEVWFEVDEGSQVYNTSPKDVGLLVDDMSYFDWVIDGRTSDEDRVNVLPTTEGKILHATNVSYEFTDDVGTDYVYVRKYTEPINFSYYDYIRYYVKGDRGRQLHTRLAVYNTSPDGSMTSCNYPRYPDIITTDWEEVSLYIPDFYDDASPCDLDNITLIKFTINDIDNPDTMNGSVLLDEMFLVKDSLMNESETTFNYKPIEPLVPGQQVRLRTHIRDNTGHMRSTDWFTLDVDDDAPNILNLTVNNTYDMSKSEMRLWGVFNDTTTPSYFWLEINGSSLYNTSARPVGYYIDITDDPNWLYASGNVKGTNVTLYGTNQGYIGRGLNVSYDYYHGTSTDYFFIENGIDPLVPQIYDSFKFMVKADHPWYHQMRMDLWCEDARPPESYRTTPRQHQIRTTDWEEMDFKTTEYFVDNPNCVAATSNITRLKLEFGDYINDYSGNGSIIIDEFYFMKRDRPDRNVQEVPFRFEQNNFNELDNFTFRIWLNDTSGHSSATDWINVNQQRFSSRPSELIQENGSLLDLAEHWRVNVVEANYTPPSYEEKERFQEIAIDLFNAIENNTINQTLLDSVLERIPDFGFELVNFTDNITNYNYFILREQNNTIRRGWGAYIYNQRSPSNLLLESPHPKWDYRSSVVASWIFTEMWPKALLISTSYRYSDRNHEADAGHSHDMLFHSVHHGLSTLLPDDFVVTQIHGFYAGGLSQWWMQSILSDSVGLQSSPNLREVEKQLLEEGILTCTWPYVYDIERVENTTGYNQSEWENITGSNATEWACTFYSARNEASAFDVYDDGGEFIHVELNTSLRYEDHPEETAKVVRALTDWKEWLPPVISLDSPFDGESFGSSEMVYLNCSASDNKNLTNVTLYVGNASVFEPVKSVSINTNESYNLSYSSTFPEGTYYWNCYASDNSNNTNTKNTNGTFTITGSNPVWVQTPVNQTIDVGIQFYYDINASDPDGIDTYWIDDAENFTIGASTGEIVNATLLSLGEYEINVYVNDTFNNILSGSFVLNVTDPSAPLVSLISPVDGFNSTSSEVSLVCSASDLNLENITLYTNLSGSFASNKTIELSAPSGQVEFNLSGLLDGSFVWNCEARDSDGNLSFASENRTVNVFSTPEYNITLFIDGVESSVFAQTALPYTVTAHIDSSGVPAGGAEVVIYEKEGNNIFIPLRQSGIISSAETTGITDSEGNITFIIAPTHYPVISGYTIGVGVLHEGIIIESKNMSISNNGSIVFQKKPLSPSVLADNAKVAVNAMNSIINSLFIWANDEKEANQFEITVYDNGSVQGTGTLQTGAPNVINITLKNESGSIISGRIKAEESGGYLLFNPTYNPPVIGDKEHSHVYSYVDSGDEFIITPTSYGAVDSEVNLEVYHLNMSFITSFNMSINPNLEPRVGSSYESDALKILINSMNSVVNSLFYALN